MAIKRIIVGESGGPTPVIDWEVAGILAAAKDNGLEVYGAMNGLKGVLHADFEGNIVNLTPLDPMQFIHNGPGAGLRTTRIKPTEEQYKTITQNLDSLGIDGIVYIGGDDSANQLLGLTKVNPDLAAIHAIKTVDNDLPETHHCPGFGSTSLFNATALKNVVSDFSGYGVNSLEGRLIAPVVIYQVMGRKAGWLAQATAFARVDPRGEMVEGRAPNIILCKEVPFDKQEYLSALESTIEKYGQAVVVVQEDLTDKASGKSLSKIYGKDKDTEDESGNIQHGRATSFSTAIYLTQLATEELKVKDVKTIKETALVPQHIQRSNEMSLLDASEAYSVGYAAVEALLNEESKKSIVLKKDNHGGFTTDTTDLSNTAKGGKQVPLEYIDGINGPTQEFVREFIGTIGGPVAIPHYSHMVYKAVKLRT